MRTPIIKSLLDLDLYKINMAQVVWLNFSDAFVKYKFKCRNNVELTPYINEIRDEINSLKWLKFTYEEINYLRTIKYLKPAFIDSLVNFHLDPRQVDVVIKDHKLDITIEGNWYQTILFETLILSIVNEVFFRNITRQEQCYTNGLKLLDEKIKKNIETPFKLIEFGTRRRYSHDWQEIVIEKLINHKVNLVGTSNVYFAKFFNLNPFGTMAHEYLQACQTFASLKDFQKFALETWMQTYRGDLGIALSDVIGMDAFFKDFDKLFSKAYDGCRHDSGDPFIFGEKLISHYEAFGIDPKTKWAVFSDGLDFDKAIELHNHFNDRIQTSFGVGTNLTADMGFLISVPQIVIKMVECNGMPVAKLSDSPGKEMCEVPSFTETLRYIFNVK